MRVLRKVSKLAAICLIRSEGKAKLQRKQWFLWLGKIKAAEKRCFQTVRLHSPLGRAWGWVQQGPLGVRVDSPGGRCLENPFPMPQNPVKF